MAVQIERHIISLEEFERMAEAGVFNEDARIELIRGEIVDMAAIGVRHAACVTRLTMLLSQRASGKVIVLSQNPFGISNHSSPQPDVALLHWRDDYYDAKRPTPEDMLLVIEVADTSINDDRKVKGPLYAEAGIAEYWIVNLRGKVIEVYTDPAKGVYRQTRHAKP